MALPTITEINNAIDDIYAALSTDKTKVGSRYAVGLLQKMRVPLLEAYKAPVDILITDLLDDSLEGLIGAAIAADGEDNDFLMSDAQDENLFVLFNELEAFAVDDDLDLTENLESNLKAHFAGELATGLGQAPVIGDTYEIQDTADTIDDDLEGAKGSAVTDADTFVVDNVTAGSESITFIGNAPLADGEWAEAKSGVAAAVGDTFRTQGTDDTVQNDLQSAKGSAVADNDLFIVTGFSLINPNLCTVSYLGNAAILAGQLSESGGFNQAPVVGDRFQVTGNGDTTDNALQTSKGSAPANGDIFEITNVTPGSVAINYLGINDSAVVNFAGISFSDEEIVDFVNL